MLTFIILYTPLDFSGQTKLKIVQVVMCIWSHNLLYKFQKYKLVYILLLEMSPVICTWRLWQCQTAVKFSQCLPQFLCFTPCGLETDCEHKGPTEQSLSDTVLYCSACVHLVSITAQWIITNLVTSNNTYDLIVPMS